MTGILTLDGGGDCNAAIWVFQIGSTLTTASSAAVNLIGGAIPGRVFWQVGSSATLGTGTQFAGNIVALASVTGTTGANIDGRALARTGAVTVDTVNGTAVPLACTIMPEPTEPPPESIEPMPEGGDVADVDRGGLSGGAAFPGSHGCSAVPSSSGAGGAGAALLLLGLFGLVAIRRRRGFFALLGFVALMLPGVARAQSVTLDQFHPPETSEDGLEVSRPIDFGHNRPGGTVYLDYAHNPLVYEGVAGSPNTQQESIVRHQLALHVGVAYGLFDRLILFAGGSGNVVMAGEGRAGYVAPDGTRFGDLTLGGRIRLAGTPRLGESSYGALGLQVGVTLPMARWISSNSQLTGEGGVMATPELLAEVGGRHLRLTLNLGARLRSTERFNTLTVGHELIWGLGLGVPLGGRTLELDVEAYGATAFSNLLSYQTSPVEAIAGLRWRGESGWTAALGGGLGLARGYGSPDLRLLATVGWARPAPRKVEEQPVAEAPAPPPPADWDHDGVIDALDRCPRVPGPADNDGCARFVQLVPTEVAPVEIVISQRIEFDTDEASTLRDVSAPILEEVRAVLDANRQLTRISIDGHADERASDAHNMALSRRRAEQVMRWLIEHGIDANRLEAHAYGEREPFATGVTPAAQQTNRNVQFFILEPAATSPAR